MILRRLPAWPGPLLALALLLPLVVDLHAETPPWAEREFYYEAEEEALADVLRAFGQKYNLAVVLSPAIAGSVSGRFQFNRAVDFLDAVSRTHGLSWHYNGTAIYFDKLEEHKSALLRLRWISPGALRSTLRKMGLLDARFPWRAIESERMVSLSGPPVYVDAIIGLVRDMEKTASEDREMRVFRLRHALADDMTITSQGSTVTIPGVATILRNITGERSTETGGVTLTPTNPQGLLGQGLARSSANNRGFSEDAPGQPTGSTRILADPRLNAVIVWDVRERMGQYEKTIAQLDQPVQLVEIQVAILEVGVNRVSELGVSWSGQSLAGQRRGEGLSAIGGANLGPAGQGPDVYSPYGYGLNVSTIYSRGLDFLLARVHALEETGDAAILSRPKVLTMDNTQATLEHVSTFYVRVEGKDTVDLFDVTYGTVLKVTPHVEHGPDGASIRMFIQIDDGNNQASQGTVDNLPIVGRSSIKTQAVVRENQTLIIGGYYYEKITGDESGVPGLMKIPVLRYLFKTNRDNVQKIERLFAIAPRLVNLAELPAAPPELPPDALTRDLASARSGPASGGGCAGRGRGS